MMQQISSPPQDGAEVVVNENLETLDHQAVYGKRHPVTTALVWGYYGGRWGGFAITDGTLTLTGSTTNYIVVLRLTGVISVSTATTNWNNAGEYARVYKLTLTGSVVTTTEDHRAGPLGIHGQPPPPAAVTIASAATIAIPLGQKVAVISGTTGITSITATGHSGATVVLIFQGVLTVTDGSNLKLSANFTTTADDTLTLASDGTSWFEVARSVN